MDHRLRLTVPADHHIEFELPEEISGEVEIIVTPVTASEPVPLEVRQRAVEIARRSRARMPKNTGDSADLISEDRARESADS